MSLEEVVSELNAVSDEQLEYYVLLSGWARLWREFDDEVIALKDKMDVK